jgi:hypothetical protein
LPFGCTAVPQSRQRSGYGQGKELLTAMTIKMMKRTVPLHGGQTLHILTPKAPSGEVTAVHFQRGDHYICANAAGFAWLADIFSLAGFLRENEILYAPLPFAHRAAFQATDAVHLDGFVCMNYCAAQVSPKVIAAALHRKPAREEELDCTPRSCKPLQTQWQRRTLTVRQTGELLYISTNGSMFYALARESADLSSLGDDPEGWAHSHFDWEENTAKSAGVTLHYWYMGDTASP